MHTNLQEANAQSIYIHIPFCKQKCNYCAFVSFTNDIEYQDKYINALIKEIENHKSRKKINTIYFGGGTPNTLSIQNFEKIFQTLHNNFDISKKAEITVELNPALTNIEYLKNIKKLGTNRLSIGVQSFNDKILKTLNRLHHAQDAIQTINDIKEAGFYNFSIDLIYGIFGQTIDDIKYDLKQVKNLSPQHISTYGLKIEENTPFEKFDTSTLPNEDLCEKMYLLIAEELTQFNYKHYEISNFAQESFQSKHNSTYWKNKEYFGFGVAAHGYLNKIRYNNTNNLIKYIQNPCLKENLTFNTSNDIFEEYVFLGLRLSEGIDLNKIKEIYNVDLYKNNEDFIEDCISRNLIKIHSNNLSLTPKGFLISNYIIGKLLD